MKRERQLHPRPLGKMTDEAIPLSMHAIKDAPDGMRPTLGGLMPLGTFPRQLFPCLNVTFAAYPGIGKTARPSDGKQFLDSQTIIGSILYTVADTVATVEHSMRTGAVIQGAFRTDAPDYPRAAVREAIANAQPVSFERPRGNRPSGGRVCHGEPRHGLSGN